MRQYYVCFMSKIYSLFNIYSVFSEISLKGLMAIMFPSLTTCSLNPVYQQHYYSNRYH